MFLSSALVNFVIAGLNKEKNQAGPVDKSKKTAETHRGPSRIINLGIAKDGILPSA